MAAPDMDALEGYGTGTAAGKGSEMKKNQNVYRMMDEPYRKDGSLKSETRGWLPIERTSERNVHHLIEPECSA